VGRRRARRLAAADAGRAPHESFKAGRLNGSEAISQNLACLSAYDGTDLVGFIIESVGAFIAYDPHDRLIGSFPTVRAAVRAIPAVRS
jgi:hypothetical protein